MELPISTVRMPVHGRLADPQLVRNFFVRQALRQELENFNLSVGQVNTVFPRMSQTGDRLWHRRKCYHLSRHANPNPEIKQAIVSRDGLEQIPNSTRLQRLLDRIKIIQSTHHDDLQSRHDALQPPRALDAVDARHPNVHQHQIRIQAWNTHERIRSIGKVAHTTELLRALKNVLYQQVYDLLVI